MPGLIEVEISDLLSERGDVNAVGLELISRWQKNLFSPEEQFDCAQFLLATGQYDALLLELRRLIIDGSLLPWAQFTELLVRGKLELNKKELEALLAAIEEQEAMSVALRSREFGERDDMFRLARLQLDSEKSQAISERRAALHDRLAFVRSQRMLDQELQILGEFEAMFPDEAEIGNAKHGFDLRWAREVVSNAGPQAERAADDRSLKLLEWKVDRLTPEQAVAKDMIVARAKELAIEAKGNARVAYDLAIGLQLMGFYRDALSLLEESDIPQASPLVPAIDWLRLELLLRARQFATALEETNRLELEYAHEPDASFAVIYARARALHGLGQETLGIELLQTLVRLRPYYKSAQSLLEEWAGGEN